MPVIISITYIDCIIVFMYFFKKSSWFIFKYFKYCRFILNPCLVSPVSIPGLNTLTLK